MGYSDVFRKHKIIIHPETECEERNDLQCDGVELQPSFDVERGKSERSCRAKNAHDSG